MADRFIRLLIRLYPADYRARYGDEMARFHHDARAAGEGGIRYWAALVLDHALAAFRVRRRSRAIGGGADRGAVQQGRHRFLARASGRGVMRDWVADFVYGARSLRRVPGFAFFAVLTLALGVGATTGVFSVLDRVVLRPLPYPGAERLALIGIEARHDPGSVGPLSGPLLADFQARPGPAEAVVAASGSGVVLDAGAGPEAIEATRVSRGFFGFFGARPALGRLLTEADHEPGSPKVAVLGQEYWRGRFGADPSVIGRSIRLDDDVHMIVGVLAPGFHRPSEIAEHGDLWIPLRLDAGAARGTFFLAGLARLRPGATLPALDDHADRIVAGVYGGETPSFVVGGAVADYRGAVLGDIGSVLGRVLAAVALLLLIACVNVASLLLTRGAARASELAVRSALGAARARLARLVLAESILIAVAGGIVGAALAWGAVELFRLRAPPGLPRLAEVAVDGRGLAFCLALSFATVLLFGLLPALRATGRAAAVSGAPTRRATAGRGEGRLRSALIAVETAIAVVLAVSSTLLAHDLLRLANEDTGFAPEGLLAARIDLASGYDREQWAGVWDRLLESARALPGVTAATVATQAPYAGTRMASTYRPEGMEGEQAQFVITLVTAGDYARVLGARVVEGRALESGDDDSPPVAVVNEAFVRRYWPGTPAVGRTVASGQEDEPVYRVVGVLADVRTHAGQEAGPQVLLPLRGAAGPDMELILRTDGHAAALAPALRALVRRVTPGTPVSRIATVEGLASEKRALPRFYTALFGGFAAVALLLAVVGVYGTTSYATRSRTREIGIRLALGAPRRGVVGQVVLRAGAVVGLGTAIGLAGAVLTSRAMGDVLVYVTSRDAASYAAVAFLVLAAGVFAAWIPARRAGGVDPAETLRAEG
ncbi:MAG TPA: ADOP family duplicated permease [Gemmatimonadota bacterium]|nr:ADOP family duplicated permease [Gemmatimonadota bacterium]